MADPAPAFAVRRVRADEGRRVRALRLEAVADPAAGIAFLSTLAEERSRGDAFWEERARSGAEGPHVAQFVAEAGGEWVGTATVLVRAAGATDHLGHVVEERRADVVGVYVRPSHRGAGVVDALLSTAASWTAALGIPAVTLDVHTGNGRARAAYERNGFVPTGVAFTGPIGLEVQLRRSLAGGGGSPSAAPGPQDR